MNRDILRRLEELEHQWPCHPDDVREIAREEIASLAGLVLGRLNADPSEPLAQKLASAFGEALRDFSQTKAEPGPKEDD